ncbi:DUF916 domain-containing protein [Weissella cibaria]|uniref:WxL protein peptidoglycan domain-containing protein n=1 Tax=Weissella cibaria TaxID=137591 RepID=UPI00255368AD|nr:DUF916 domain-containing protein [Weissella cibaria]MDK9676975.1 DUF916 domain-containing protein [Weissella cibaria]
MRRSAWKIFWCVGVSCIFAINNGSPQRVDAATLKGRYTSIHIAPRHDLSVANDKTVFAFQYQPETTYDVAVDLQNMTSQTHKLTAQLLDATVGDNGAYTYQTTQTKVGIRQFSHQTKQRVVLKPNEKHRVHFQLRMPKRTTTTTYFGGLKVIEYDQANSGLLRNDVSFVTSVLLGNQTLETTHVKRLNVQRVQRTSQHGKLGYNVVLQNRGPKIVQHVATKVALTDGAKHQISKTQTISFIAHGRTTIFVPDKGQAIKPQKVTVTLHTETDDTVKTKMIPQPTIVTHKQKDHHSSAFLFIVLILSGFAGLMAAVIVWLTQSKNK